MKDERWMVLFMFCVGLAGFFFQLLSLTFLQISLPWIQALSARASRPLSLAHNPRIYF